MLQRARRMAWLLIAGGALAWPAALWGQATADSAARLDSLAVESERQGTREGLRRAVELWTQGARLSEHGRQPRLAVPMLRNAGRVLLALGHADSATTHFRRSLHLAREAGDRAGEGGALNALGVVARAAGRPDSALAYFRRALSVVKAAGDRVLEGRTLSNIGAVYHDLGLPDSALFHYHQALDAARATGNRVGEGMTLGNIGGVHSSVGRIDSALTYYGQNLAIARALGDRPGEAAMLYNLGTMQSMIGRSDSALTYFRQALDASRALGAREGEGAALGGLGAVFEALGQGDSALVYHRGALAVAREIGDREGEGLTLANVGVVHQRSGRPDSAFARMREALVVMRELKRRRGEGLVLHNIGALYQDRSQFDSALVAYRQSLGIRREIRDREGEGQTLGSIGRVYHARRRGQDISTALAFYDSAAAALTSIAASAGGDANRVSYAEGSVQLHGDWMRAWLASAARVGTRPSVGAALAAAERGRAQALLALMRPGSLAAVAGAPGAVSAPGAAVSSPGADMPAEADSLLAPLRARGAAALSYAYANDTLYAWLLRPSGELELLPPLAIARDTLNRLVQAVRAGLDADAAARRAVLDPDELAGDTAASKTATGDLGADLTRLAAVLLPPHFARHVPARAEVVVVPTGPLALVPFAALPVAGSGAPATVPPPRRPAGVEPAQDAVIATPLGLRHAVRYGPSFAALRAAERRPSRLARPTVAKGASRASASRRPARGAAAPAGNEPAPRRGRGARGRTAALAGALVVGNPTMPTLYSGRWVTRGRLRALPGAEAEARWVAGAVGARVLTGTAATETAVLRRLAAAPLVHFATHGLAYSTEAKARLSFVALGSDAKRDGLLTVGELLDDPDLTLTADLVVLSACQTGLGNVRQAEGTVGLQRAFLARGARSVLVSLWSVDDAATRLLMQRFYAHWLDRAHPVTKVEALRLAQEDLRRMPAYAHPRYWAAFQLVGAD